MTQGAPPVGQRMLRPDGTPVYVSPEEAAEAFRTGQLGFDPSDSVPVQTDNGVQTVRGDQAAALLDQNPFQKLSSYEALAGQREREEYSGVANTVAASAIAAGSSLAAGSGRGMAVDFAGSLFGEDAQRRTREYLRKQEEYHPTASLVGEAAGFIAPMFLTAGASGVARGAAAAGEVAPSVLSRIGQVVTAPTRAIGAIAEAGGGVAARVGAEGSLLSRAAGSAARGAIELGAYEAGNEYSRARLEDRELTAERLLSAAGHGALLGATFGGGLVVGGELASRTLSGAGRMARAGAEKGAELIEKLGMEAPSLDKIAVEHAIKSTGAKLPQIRELTAMGDAVAQRVADTIVKELPKEIGAASLARMGRDKIAHAAEKRLERLGGEYDAMIKKIDAAADVADRPVLSDVADKIRREVVAPLQEGALTASAKKKAQPVLDDLAEIETLAADKKLTFEQVNNLRKEIGERIDWISPNLTGAERAANNARKDLYRALDAEFSRAAEAVAQREGDTFSIGWDAIKKDYQATKWVRDASKHGAESELRNNTFSLGSMVAGGGGASAGATIGTTLAGAAGGLFGGVVGNVAGQIAGNLVKRFGNQAAATLATHAAQGDIIRAIERTVQDTTGASVSQLVRGAIARAPSAGATAGSALRVEAAQDRQREYERRRTALARFVAAPSEYTRQRLAGTPPVVAAAVTSAAVRGAEYLQSIAPKPLGGSPLQPQADHGQVDPAARDRWLRAARAVDDPQSVVEDARRGALTPEAVDALRAVYPRIYGEIQGRVMAELAERKTPLGYRQAQQISILLGQPADGSLSPGYLRATQAGAPVAADEQQAVQTSKISVNRDIPSIGSDRRADT